MYRNLRSVIALSSAALFTLWVAVSPAHARPSVNKATGGGTYEKAGFLNTIAFTAQVDESGVAKGEAQQLRRLVVIDAPEQHRVDLHGSQAFGIGSP